MGQARCGEEDAHDGARGGDAEQDGDGAEHPSLLLRAVIAAHESPGAIEREEEERVEEEDGGALQPSADGIDAHGIGGDADDDAEREDGALKGDNVAGATPEEHRQQQDEGERAQDVDVGESGVRGEVGVQSGKLWRRVGAGRRGERDDAADDDGDSDHHAEPEADFQAEGKSGGEDDARGCSLACGLGILTGRMAARMADRIAVHGDLLISMFHS